MTDPTPPSRAFVLGLADADGHLDGAALYTLGEAIGFSDTKVRLTVKRLVDAGLLETSGRGRSATIHLTDVGLEERTPDLGWAALAYRLDAERPAWDGRWHVVSFEIPESARAGRDALRAQLVDLLGASIGGGLYVSAHAWEPWADAVARRHGVERHVTTLATDRLRVGGVRDVRAIAAQLWPLADLDRRGQAFVDRWSAEAITPPTDLAAAARAAFAASVEFEGLMRDDPLLPPELTPIDWRGPDVRRIYRELVGALSRRHPAIERANVFAAFLAAIDHTAAMADAEFGRWLWQSTRPR